MSDFLSCRPNFEVGDVHIPGRHRLAFVPFVALVAAALGPAYERRIATEERLLGRDLPCYAASCEDEETRPLRLVAGGRITVRA